MVRVGERLGGAVVVAQSLRRMQRLAAPANVEGLALAARPDGGDGGIELSVCCLPWLAYPQALPSL